MDEVQPQPNLEDFLRHSTWVQALARHLVREDPEDLVQDVWVLAAQRPSRVIDTPRAWLAKLLQNRARSRGRAEQRRRRREAATEMAPASAPTPQEMAERLEMHRLLAQLISELPPQYQQVVYLRYVEDKEPTEIAKLLDVPAGTIRWRLSEALSRLRSRLDEREGGRKAWMAMFLAWDRDRPPELAPAPEAPRGWRPALIPLAAGVSVCAAVFLLWRLGDTPAPERSSPDLVRQARGPRLPGGGSDRSPRFATVATEQQCGAVEPMRAFALQVRTAADPWRDVRDVFKESAPNPRLEAAFGPVLDGMFGALPEGCDHTLTCRGRVCEVAILSPDGMKPWDCHPRPKAEFMDRLSSGMNNTVDSGTPFFDPVKRRGFTRMSQMWRFHRDDASPQPQNQRPALPEVTVDLGRAPTMAANLPQSCVAEWRALERQVERLNRWLSEMRPESVFAANPSNDGLRDRFMKWAGRVLERPPGSLPFRGECRGKICALYDLGAQDPLAITWQCHEPAAGMPPTCGPARNGSWFERLEENLRPFGRLRPTFKIPSEPKLVPAYFVLRKDDDRPRPWVATLAFMDTFEWKAAARTCESQFPERGALSFRLDVPETSGDEQPPNRMTLHLGGALGGGRLAHCLSDAFEAAAAQFTIPPIANGAVLYSDLTFPFDPRNLETKLERIRERLKTDTPALPF